MGVSDAYRLQASNIGYLTEWLQLSLWGVKGCVLHLPVVGDP